MRTVMRFNSANYASAYISLEAYREVRLSVTSMEFGSHDCEVCEVDEEEYVIELEDIRD